MILSTGEWAAISRQHAHKLVDCVLGRIVRPVDAAEQPIDKALQGPPQFHRNLAPTVQASQIGERRRPIELDNASAQPRRTIGATSPKLSWRQPAMDAIASISSLAARVMRRLAMATCDEIADCRHGA